MLSQAWLSIAQHVFQPALTGRPELISRKIVSGEPGTKAIAVSRFRKKLAPANWVQGVTAISRKISRSWAPQKWGPTCDRDISNSLIYTTAEINVYQWKHMQIILAEYQYLPNIETNTWSIILVWNEGQNNIISNEINWENFIDYHLFLISLSQPYVNYTLIQKCLALAIVTDFQLT